MSANRVAVIGAVLSGLALALALKRQSISCTIYEARSASLDIGGAIMLSPNALRVLDAVDIYEKVKPVGFQFGQLHFYTDKPPGSYSFGHEAKYGYDALRIYGYELIDALLIAIKENSIPVEYGKKFTNDLRHRDRRHLEFDDGTGTICHMSCLVGADSIQLPVTLMNPKHGAFVIAPQREDGSELLIGKQRLAPELDREGWNALLNDKQWCVEFLREGSEEFPEIVQPTSPSTRSICGPATWCPSSTRGRRSIRVW